MVLDQISADSDMYQQQCIDFLGTWYNINPKILINMEVDIAIMAILTILILEIIDHYWY